MCKTLFHLNLFLLVNIKMALCFPLDTMMGTKATGTMWPLVAEMASAQVMDWTLRLSPFKQNCYSYSVCTSLSLHSQDIASLNESRSLCQTGEGKLWTCSIFNCSSIADVLDNCWLICLLGTFSASPHSSRLSFFSLILLVCLIHHIC